MAPSRGEHDQTDEPQDAIASRSNVAVIGPRGPPPESSRSVSTRRYIVLSFWLTALLLGLPLWWTTTTIERAPLPVDAMLAWSQGTTCEPTFPLSLTLDAPNLSPEHSRTLVESTQHTLDSLTALSSHRLHLSVSDSTTNAKPPVLIVRLAPSQGGSQHEARLRPHSNVLEVFYAPDAVLSQSSSSEALNTFLANRLSSLFAEEQAILAHALLQQPTNPHYSGSALSITPSQAESFDRRKTRSVKYAPSYHLTFSLLTASHRPSEWDIESALAETIQPLVNLIRPVTNFTIDTQIHSYAKLSTSVAPQFSPGRKAWMLSREDLGSFINAAEWPLSPSIGAAPTINFVLYVPDPALTPLVIDGIDTAISGNSWLVPQWGGISILNPTSSLESGHEAHLSAADLELPLLQFGSDLLSLLGLPAKPEASLPLQIQTLQRALTWTLVLSASATLGALARLTESLPSIAIPESVAVSVHDTLADLSKSCAALKNGDFELAFHSARAAETAAEKAFFEPSMVGQVYFPDEHKVAVYLPLLGPIAVPLILGAVKELGQFIRSARKQGIAS